MTRQVATFSDDTFLTSYPRSGNTWVRFLLGNLLHGTPTTFDNFNERVPDIYKTDNADLEACARPRVLKSHEHVRLDYPRVIYLVRDPRDVAVLFRYLKMVGRLDGDALLSEFVTRFVDGDVPFGSWDTHVRGWISTRGDDPTFLCVRYEDLRRDTRSELARIATFIAAHADSEQLDRAMALSTRDNMRRLEDAHRSGGGSWLREARADMRFVGSGDVPTKISQLLQPITERWALVLGQLGYL